jgi:hypothetical protein
MLVFDNISRNISPNTDMSVFGDMLRDMSPDVARYVAECERIRLRTCAGTRATNRAIKSRDLSGDKIA